MRSDMAVKMRRRLFVRMYEIASTFHKSRQPKKNACTDNDDSGDGGDMSNPTATTEYSSNSWFELSVEQQRCWFTSLRTGTYQFGELTREAFDQVDAIFTLKYKGAERRAAPYTQQRKATQGGGAFEKFAPGNQLQHLHCAAEGPSIHSGSRKSLAALSPRIKAAVVVVIMATGSALESTRTTQEMEAARRATRSSSAGGTETMMGILFPRAP